MSLRSRLVPEEQPNRVLEPNRLRQGPSQSELICRSCGDLFFVDEISFHDALSAMEMGLESAFYCNECETEQEGATH